MRSVVVEIRSSSVSEISMVLVAASVADPRLMAVFVFCGTIETLEFAFTAALSAIF